MRARQLWRLAILPAALAFAVTAAAPASAGVSPALFDADVHTSPSGYTLVSHCSITAGFTTDPRYITYVVHAEATAGGPSVALATSVQCTIYDALDRSRTYGGASGGMPGPHAEAVGFATAPIGAVLGACVNSGATYLDGHTETSANPCP